MCSIGGFISAVPLEKETAKRLCRALLFFGSSRGQQSAGIYVNKKLYKRAIHPAEFIYDDAFDELFDIDPSCALVHTRQPTSGGTGNEQAHPFWIGNTISVHNGGIFNCAELKKKWSLEKPSGVDSELVTAAIEAYGIAKLPEIIKDVSGSAAIATIHNDELYLMRDGNPLEYYEIKLTHADGTTSNLLVFASTMSQLKDAIQHCWLMRNLGTSITLPSAKIFKCSPSGVLTESGSFSTASYFISSMSSSSHYYGGGRGSQNPMRQDTQRWMGGRPGNNLVGGGGTININGMAFSFKAALTILESSEDTIPRPMAAGYGFKLQPRGYNKWSHELACAQHLKWDPTFQWARDLLEEPTTSDGLIKQHGKKKKKDRNRNQSQLLLPQNTPPQP
jgi:hypothetical protein